MKLKKLLLYDAICAFLSVASFVFTFTFGMKGTSVTLLGKAAMTLYIIFGLLSVVLFIYIVLLAAVRFLKRFRK